MLSRARGDGFVARLWLENDGDQADQRAAAARAGWQADGEGQVVRLGAATLWHGVGRRAAGDLARACAAHDWVVTPEEVPGGLGQPPLPPAGQRRGDGRAQGACRIIGPEVLRQTGAIALGSDRRMRTAREEQGRRPWVPRP